MAETPRPPGPAPQIPKLPTTLPFEDEAARVRRQGCLKWGLVGCAGASVLVIVGLLFVLSNAKKFMGVLFEKVGDQVVAAAAPEVTPAEKERFRTALAAFAERAKAQKVSPSTVQAWQTRVTGALSDGRVTGDEIRSLTAWLETSGTAPPPTPAK
jgi:hypothetical protein